MYVKNTRRKIKENETNKTISDNINIQRHVNACIECSFFLEEWQFLSIVSHFSIHIFVSFFILSDCRNKKYYFKLFRRLLLSSVLLIVLFTRLFPFPVGNLIQKSSFTCYMLYSLSNLSLVNMMSLIVSFSKIIKKGKKNIAFEDKTNLSIRRYLYNKSKFSTKSLKIFEYERLWIMKICELQWKKSYC